MLDTNHLLAFSLMVWAIRREIQLRFIFIGKEIRNITKSADKQIVDAHL